MPLIDPVVPDYENRCTSNVVPQLLRALDGEDTMDWVPQALRDASQVVLLVVDGMGWHQLQDRKDLIPTLNGFDGSAITTSLPTTTPACLTTIVTGTNPAQHGIIGYRMSLEGERVMDSQKWTVDDAPGKDIIDPYTFQQSAPFMGRDVPSIIRSAFIGSGLTDAQFRHGRLIGYQFPSSLPERIRLLLAGGDKFVYAYYDGLDITAHSEGIGAMYDAELHYVDQLIDDILSALPAGTALVVTADHGHVNLDDGYLDIAPEIVANCTHLSGEPRFRWLHVPPAKRDETMKRCIELYDDVAWVRTLEETIEDNWYGEVPAPHIKSRLGDIALVAAAPIGFMEPTSRSAPLASRHGSLTKEEVYVPFLVHTVS